MRIISHSVKETHNIGRVISGFLGPQDIICLQGDLGTGKTELTKGIAIGLGLDKGTVTSSSFIVIRRHVEGRLPLYHFDFYRINKAEDISFLGCEEYFCADGICVIEWAERLDYLMPEDYLMVKLSYGKQGERVFKFNAEGLRYKELLNKIKLRLKGKIK